MKGRDRLDACLCAARGEENYSAFKMLLLQLAFELHLAQYVMQMQRQLNG